MSQEYISVALRQAVAEQSRYRCAYCQSQQRIVGGSLTIDHIVPQAKGGQTVLANLCLACWGCNLSKGGRVTAVDSLTQRTVRLFHPVQQQWEQHFQWQDGGLYVVGLTPMGRATVTALQLNRPQLVESRHYWIRAGWHPPEL